MKNEHIELKLNIKSLMAEAIEARNTERDLQRAGDNEARERIHNHRVCSIRPEARHAQLAYAYMRGRKYKDVEQTVKRPADVTRLTRKVKKFGGDFSGVLDWIQS